MNQCKLLVNTCTLSVEKRKYLFTLGLTQLMNFAFPYFAQTFKQIAF